jgi:radical SAM superfamily enzyme YgiQ (UPF0313 family)
VSVNFAHRVWRQRDPEDCIQELELAKKELSPNLRFVVFDDCPTVNKERFNEFLRLYIKRINCERSIVNTRADCINDEMLDLMKQCPVRFLTIGVEHGNPEVFKLVNKNETFEQIEEACRLIKKHGIRLGVSFIIGLPLDNYERTKDSINLYKKLKAEQLFLNEFIPYKATAAREWFENNNGIITGEFVQRNEYQHPLEWGTDILVETKDFTAFERQKAYYMFLFEVAEPRLKMRYIFKIINIAWKYNLTHEFITWLLYGVWVSLKDTVRKLGIAFYVFRKTGFKGLVNKIRKSI